MNETFKKLAQFLRTKTVYSIEWDGPYFYVLESDFRRKYDKTYDEEAELEKIHEQMNEIIEKKKAGFRELIHTKDENGYLSRDEIANLELHRAERMERAQLPKRNFVCNIKFGDLIKESGDILLCPLSENFVPSNFLAQSIVRTEGKWLKDKLENLCSLSKSGEQTWEGSEHVAFLPCRKLKYRGILFVCVDFYSRNRGEINQRRIAEALKAAEKYRCCRLSCSENFLYSPDVHSDYGYLLYQLDLAIQKLSDKDKIRFGIDFIVRRDFEKFKSTELPEEFSKIFEERLPWLAQILPHYRKRLKSVRTQFNFSNSTAKKLRTLLTQELSEKEARKIIRKLHKNVSLDDLELILNMSMNELPWNSEKNYERLRKIEIDGEQFESFRKTSRVLGTYEGKASFSEQGDGKITLEKFLDKE